MPPCPQCQGKPCSQNGEFLPPETPPVPPPLKPGDDWTPFVSRAGFEAAEILYSAASLSNDIVDRLLSIWRATLVPHDDEAPITDHRDLHLTIDAINLGHVPWQSYTAHYQGLCPDDAPTPEWMTTDYQLWYRDPRRVIHNILANPNLHWGRGDLETSGNILGKLWAPDHFSPNVSTNHILGTSRL